MTPKRFLTFFVLIILLVAFSIGAGNYYFDYYGVLSSDGKYVRAIEQNDRFIKMKYLLTEEHFCKYDTYILGSSRVMKMDSRIGGDKCYNLGVPSCMPQDCLEQIQVLLAHNAPIRTIYLGLDDVSYLRDYNWVKTAGYGWMYKDEWKNDTEAYLYYLFRYNFLKNALRRGNTHPQNKLLIDIHGNYSVPDIVEKQIEQQPEKHAAEKKFQNPATDGWVKTDFSECIKTLGKIKEICDYHGIQLTLFFNPQHMTTYLADDMELMNRFKKELVKISPFWDFSGVNYVTANNYFWYETSHPRAFICDKILDTVSGQNQITWVPDFGVYVTPENVDAFCEKAVRDRAAYDPDHEQWIPSPEERKRMTKRLNY